jgi:Rieske Fe-S protein
VESDGHQPSPSIWPLGFAVGVVVLLVGLIVSPWLLGGIGLVIAIVFGALWAHEATREVRVAPPEPEVEEEPARPSHVPVEPEAERFPRNKFLEGATLGVGAVIGGMVALPALGFMILPAFTDVKPYHVDLGPLDNFPEGKYLISTFLLYPEQGEVSRRTAFVRNNGFKGNQPSFTIISNTCAHLGCPVQANGPVFDTQKKTLTESGLEVTLIPTQPAGFGCPCHGGQYDTEGNRTAGPPVRALDRYEFSIVHGNLWLGRIFSVSTVAGTGADAQIQRYQQAYPGEHLDAPEGWLYPLQPPRY